MPDSGAPLPPDLPSPDGGPLAREDSDVVVQLAVPLPPEGVGSLDFWREEIRDAQKRRKKELPGWKAHLSRYRGERPKLTGVASTEVITVNVDFYNTEQKKAQLFFQNPEVIVAPKGQGATDPNLLAQAAARATVVNYYLGPHELNAARMVDEVLFDHLCPAGFGASVIGYEEASVQIPDPTAPAVPTPDPGAPTPLPVPTLGQRIWHRYYWEHISPEKLLRPARWTSTDAEGSPWLGYEVDVDEDQLGQGTIGTPRRSLAVNREDSLVSPNDKEFQQSPRQAYVIWYKAYVYDASVVDRRLMRRLVLSNVDGDTNAAIHEDSQFQTKGPQGQFASGMLGNPIHLLFLRPLTASAYPPSDCAVSRGVVDELSLGRTQMMLQKRRSLPQRGFDRNRVSKGDIDKIVAGDWQGLVPLDGNPNELIVPISQTSFPRDNFQFNEVAQQDADRLWALGANQQSVATNTKVTATQSSLIQQATDTRLTKERNRVLEWYAQGAEKLMALLERFAQADDLTPLLGAQGLPMWSGQPPAQAGQPPQPAPAPVPGRFLFSIRPDSSVRTDAAEDLSRLINAYNVLARDPHINRVALIEAIVTKFGLDPSKLVIPQLPPQAPDAPKVVVSLKAEDLTEPTVISLMADYGVQLPADTVTQTVATATGHPLPPGATQPPGQLPQAPSPSEAMHPAPVPAHRPNPSAPQKNRPHPGAALRAVPLTQHQADQTGEPVGAKPFA